MTLRDFGTSLPQGFTFYPTDEKLVCHYLHKKIANQLVDLRSTLVEIDLHYVAQPRIIQYKSWAVAWAEKACWEVVVSEKTS
ncbi:hypothetical protein U1Q18_019354 [Sarracenia purpurea var. burkii]